MTAASVKTNRKLVSTILATATSIHGRATTYLAASQTGQIVLIYDEHEEILYYSQVTGAGTRSPRVSLGKVEGGATTYLTSNNCLFEIER